ncbi:MAG: hypothetical protein ACRC0C_20020 [Gibbsiella quercinecans]|uniref:hypothetical protein n=1 Tax=Gibbsiella quercinecans TaxID=929813 RepID=UPI003F3D9596
MNRILYILAFFIILLPTKTWAELSQGIENDACFKKNNNDYHKAHDCLSAMKDESEARLEKLIQATNDLIVKNNDVPVFQSDDPNLTIGDVYSKHFLASQKDWQKYKKNLCLGVAI